MLFNFHIQEVSSYSETTLISEDIQIINMGVFIIIASQNLLVSNLYQMHPVKWSYNRKK